MPFNPASIDAVILTHAHIDHSGYLPLLARQGFKGKVYCSPATVDLCGILLPDCGYLLEEEADYLNRHKLSRHAPALPLYTRDDAQRCLKLFETVSYRIEWQPAEVLTAMLAPSGHMPGSSFVRVDNGTRSILFSGDIGRPNDLVLAGPSPILTVSLNYASILLPQELKWRRRGIFQGVRAFHRAPVRRAGAC